MIMQVSLSRPPLIINSCKRIFTPQLHHVRTISLSKINCKMIENIDALTRQLAPPLTNDKYKGLAGRIGVFGGSLEYTGAPYFAAISALKVGADLSHVFCTREAAPVIKSYSPELIVHPLLDAPDAAAKIEPWLDRLHVIIIGPGLGREPHAFKVVTEVILKCRSRKKPLVIDADGLHYVATHFEMLNEYPAPIVLTPNAAEFQKLTEAEGEGDKQEQAAKYLGLTKSVTFICKGHEDEIFNGTSYVKVSGGGSGRRCGGQGDLLSGATAAFLFWATQSLESDEGPVVAAYAACKLARACNGKGFAKYGRSMTCSDMIREIHDVFEELYEPCEK